VFCSKILFQTIRIHLANRPTEPMASLAILTNLKDDASVNRFEFAIRPVWNIGQKRSFLVDIDCGGRL